MRELNKPTYLRNKYSDSLCQSCGNVLEVDEPIAYDGKAHHTKCHPWTFKDEMIRFIMKTETYKGTGNPGKQLFEELFVELDEAYQRYRNRREQ